MSPGPKLPRVTSADLVRALKRAGWFEVPQKGSYLRLRHDARLEDITIAMHAGDIPTGTLRAILRQARMTQDELRELL
jgi:predicted RNA binding protein YcfA (HicA-like mRNA interferase family)